MNLTTDKGNGNTPSVQLATFSNYLRSQLRLGTQQHHRWTDTIILAPN